MKFKDIVDYNPELVLITTDEDKVEILRNPLYLPILSILREGYKSLKQIQENYKEYSDKESVPSIKSLYRHMKHLKDAGLVSVVGKRIYDDQTKDETLFGRTAIFFYMRDDVERDIQDDKFKGQTKILADLLKITLDISQPTSECISDLVKKIREVFTEGHDLLFGKNIEKIAPILTQQPLEDLRTLVYDYCLITLLLRSQEFEKNLKNCLGAS